MNTTLILKRPILTEKSMSQAALHKYTFAVDKRASKWDVAAAIKEMFSVGVLSVRTHTTFGKPKRIAKTRRKIYQSAQKIAVVTIPDSQKIPIFEQLQKEQNDASKKV